MRKTFILDTNILIHDPYCIYNFRGNDVILPIYVIEEIDKLKRNQNTAIQARLASRVLDEIRKEGSLFKGVELKNDIFFRVEIKNDMKLLPEVLKKDVVDNYIISVTLGIKKDNPDKRVIIVTKDINMRIKADALGLEVEDYSTDKVDYTELYDGFYEVEVDSKTFGQYEKNGKMDFMDLGREDIIPTPNSFFKLNCKGNILTGRYENGKIKKFLLGIISESKVTIKGELVLLNALFRFPALACLLSDSPKYPTPMRLAKAFISGRLVSSHI